VTKINFRLTKKLAAAKSLTTEIPNCKPKIVRITSKLILMLMTMIGNSRVSRVEEDVLVHPSTCIRIAKILGSLEDSLEASEVVPIHKVLALKYIRIMKIHYNLINQKKADRICVLLSFTQMLPRGLETSRINADSTKVVEESIKRLMTRKWAKSMKLMKSISILTRMVSI